MPATVSNLIVTNRLPFIDWWTWNITKQTHRPDEVVVATNYPFLLEEDAEAFAYTIRQRLQGIPCHIIYMEPNRMLGDIRQAALNEAVGDYIVWSDDDDWYHPTKIEWLLSKAEEGWRIAMFPLTHRLFLHSGALYQWTKWLGLHLPATIYRAADAHGTTFPSKMVGEDGEWTAEIVKKAGMTIPDVVFNEKMTAPNVGGIILVHSQNTFQKPEMLERHYEGDGERLDDYPPPTTSREEWASLRLQLHELQRRLLIQKL